MKTKLAALSALVLLCAASAKAESIAPGGTYSQDFNGIGSAANASLPSGWTVNNSMTVRSVTQELYQGAGPATALAGTGSGTGNGIYNWGDAGIPADRGVGFLASGRQTKTGNLYLWLEASGVIPDFTISYDMKCYRNNSNQFQFQLYYSTDDGTTWTSAGSSFCTTYNTGTAGEVDPAGVTSVASETLELSEPLSSGDSIIFCWSYSVPSGSTTSNSQGLGIDNVVIEAGSSNLTQLNPPDVTVWAEKNDLWLSWTANEHAYDYEMQVLDSDGEPAGMWSFNPEQSPAQWSGVHIDGLSEESEYTVRVRVIGDGTTYATSAWFEDTFYTTADPWRPEWTIGDPTPSPFVGTAFSFGVTAARYVVGFEDNPSYYDPQTVSFDGLTPVPTGTQPTFANGVFSWTPGMDDDGNYVAAFSVQNDGGTYSTNVAFTVRGTTENREIFFEGFSGCAGTWAGQRFLDAEDDVPAARTDVDTWRGKSLYNAPSAMRFGNGSNHGWIVSPLIVLANDAASATVTVSFDACALQSTSTTIKFSVLDANGNAIAGFAEQTVTLPVLSLSGDQTTLAQGLADANESAQSFTFTAPGSFRLKFDASSNGNSNVAIDSVKVAQKISTSLVDLDVPEDLAIIDGTLTTNAVTVAWGAVANASGYDVQIRTSGEAEWTDAPSVTAAQAALSNLADDTDYEVRVRATGDTSLYNFSDWSAPLSVHTVRSALHPTLTVGAWQNACEAGKVYGVIENTATVSATLDDGTTPVAVALVAVAPAPSSAPVLADGTLTWTPAAEDEGTTFTLFFEMTPAPGVAYTNAPSFKVDALPALQPPTVTVDESSVTNADGKASGRVGLSWDSQFRATDYAVRAWTGSPNLAATATRLEEPFLDFHEGARPVGWTFKCASTAYTDAGAPVKLEATGHWFGTFDLGGVVTNVAFRAGGHSAANGSSVLRVYGVGALSDEDFGDKDNWGEPLAEIAVSEFGTTDRDFSLPVAAALGVRRIAWQYTKDGGNVGVGSVVIEGTGFATPKFLPGWGPTPVSQGLVQSCTVTPTRAGRTNWAEVSVTDGTATYASVVKIDVPDANPVTLLILK